MVLSQDRNITSNVLTCPFCSPDYQKKFNGSKGLKMHVSRVHRDRFEELKLSSQTLNGNDFRKTISHLKCNIPVLKRIPKGARIQAARKLSSIIDSCVNNNDETWWEHLLVFAYVSLRVPSRKSTTKSLSHEVKKNTKSWHRPDNFKYKSKVDETTNLRNRVEMKVSKGDIRGAVKLLSSSDTLAPRDESTFQELQTKHPGLSRNHNFPDAPFNDTDSLAVTEKEVRNTILSFPNGSASGIDGMRPRHLKDMLLNFTANTGKHLLASLTKLCNLMLRGKVNHAITDILYGALSKKNGGIRPIAVGNTFRRLLAKLGCEAAVHCCRIFIHQNTDTQKVLLKINFRNAFNTVEGDEMLKCVKDRIPKLYNFLFQCYSKSSQLFFGEKRILSQVGAQQGDPAGSLLFCLVIQAVIENLNSELNIFYLDDGTLGGDPNTVLHDLDIIIKLCWNLGLQTKPSKSEFLAWAAIEIINATDRSIEVAFESISNISFDEQQWCIASLPIKFGGLGLRKVSDIMLLAFLASVNSVLEPSP
ncbi:hypothetical protein ILUMI_04009 [Ignelater luminosus]|uniref:Reverse transcriptase domain-containing protein n=1 Tax=Ignelater luminosus TaxID=2038154 RepID=A0A8K0DEP9_IGNLU|nr:hypothetical protein ILUMI_04009 [Ignelater luminosus]